MTTSIDGLLPCPFCGSDTVQTREVRWNPVMTRWVVSCVRGCEMDGPADDSEQGAIDLWNTRTPAPSLGEDVVERVARAICKAARDHWFASEDLAYSNEQYRKYARAALTALRPVQDVEGQ